MPSLRSGAAAALLVPVFAGAVGGQVEPELTVAMTARAMQPGEVVRIDVSCSCSKPLGRVRATVFSKDIEFAPAGSSWQALVGIDLETRARQYALKIDATGQGMPPLTAARTLRVAARTFPTRRLRVAPEFVEPPPDALERIALENERIASLIQIVSARHWDGVFLTPVAPTITSDFGTRTLFNGQPRAPHLGVDLAGETGTPVKAPSGGRIALADNFYLTGNTLIIDHGQGLYSLLAHLSRFAVDPGADITAGAVVGFVGATGRVTGPHLHWSTRLNGARVNPMSLVELGAPAAPASAR